MVKQLRASHYHHPIQAQSVAHGGGPVEPYPFILNVADQDYDALGRLVIYCAHLELLLLQRARRGLSAEAAEKQADRPVTDNLKKLETSLPTVTHAEARQRLERAHAVLGPLFEQRNALVHGAWLVDKQAGRAIAVNPRKGRAPKYGDEVAALLPLAVGATNDLLRAVLIENDQGDFPLPVEFRYGPPDGPDQSG